MVRKIIIALSVFLSLFGCAQKRYKIDKDQYGEPLLNEKAKYSFTALPTQEDLNKIDTTAYYVQVFECRYYNEEEKKNPGIIIFHNDGFFRKTSLLAFGKFDKHRERNSIAYGGKYKINESEILTERFLPASQGKTKWYIRRITKGKINNNKIIFKDKNLIDIFEKKKTLPKIGNQ